MHGDTSELRKRAKGIEHDKEAPSKEHLTALKDYGAKSLEEQQSIRGFSGTLPSNDLLLLELTRLSETEPESIALAVLSSTPNLGDLNETKQKLALEYLAIQLAVRDREQLIQVLCHSSPDLLTSSIRTIIPAYDPIIRALHNAADLSGSVSDLEAFLNDLIKVSTVDSKAKKGESAPASVEDYCRLLQRHQGSSHRFIHQVLKNSKELKQWYYDYAAHAAKQYKQTTERKFDDEDLGIAGAGDFTQNLENLISPLPSTDIAQILSEIDAYANYLASLSYSSTNSMKTIIRELSSSDDSKIATQKGPGIYLSRWQALMDQTPITPATSKGPVRSGRSESVRDATMVDCDGEKKGGGDVVGEENSEASGGPPDVSCTIRLLGPGFKDLLREVVKKEA